MTLHISEADVRAVFTMPLAIAAVEEVSRKQASGEVAVHARRRFEFPGSAFFHHMAAADYASELVATKQYTYVKGKLIFAVMLYSLATGELLALIEGDYLGQLRTGAASGVATKYLGRLDARVAAIIGTGGQARTQLEAVAAVRKLEAAFVYGRDEQRRERFASEMSTQLKMTVRAAASSAEAVAHAGVICTATTASQPVLFGKDIPPGAHINAIGANHMRKRELDEAAVLKADLVATDLVEQSRQEAGDLVLGFQSDAARWDCVVELSQIVGGKVSGRTGDSQITLFKSNGIAAWDMAAAARTYALAKERRLGRPLALWQPAG